MNDFSVALGLLDYVNVILAILFYILICKKLKSTMKVWLYRTLIVGAVISVIMGFFVPTIKVIVGFGLLEFETPKWVLFITYCGFLLVGGSLFLSTCKKFKPNNSLLAFDIYTVAVLFGGVGRILIYVSLLKMSVQKKGWIPLVIIAVSLLLQLFQVYEASGGSVPVAWFHWLIEITNITTQALLLLGTWLIFKKPKISA